MIEKVLNKGDRSPAQPELRSVGLQLGTVTTPTALSLAPVCVCSKKGKTVRPPRSAARAVSGAYLHCHQIGCSPAHVRVQPLVLLCPGSLLVLAGLHTG